MKIISSAWLILLAALPLWATAGNGQTQDIVIGAHETYPRAITSWNGRIVIRGIVTDTVLVLGGKLVLSGEIRGDLLCIGARVELQENARIRRDMIIIGGTLQRAETSRIDGEFFYIRTKDDFKKILSSLLPFLPGTGGQIFFKIIKIIFWFILMLLVLAIFPQRIHMALERFSVSVLRCGEIGLLALIAFVFLLVLCIILSFVFIGIPLLLLLIIFYFVLLTFGRTVVLSHVGHRAMSLSGFKSNNPVFWLTTGALVYMLLKFLPFLGALLLIGIDIFAIGVGITNLFRSRRAS